MAQPSTQDIVKTLDVTGLAQIEGADINQIVDTAVAAVAIGFNITTVDVATVPTVPNANVNTKWKRYIWRRETAAETLFYFWNANATSDVTYLKWQQPSLANIPDGSITNAKLAGGITKNKILSLDWSQLENVPPLTATGAAGGDLQGTYPNPTVKANAINSLKLQSDAVTDANRAVGELHIKTDAVVTRSIKNGNVTADKLASVQDWSSFVLTLPSIAVYTALTVAGQSFTSAEFALVAGLVGNVAHGIAVTPRIVEWVLVCKTIDVGYAVGDEVGIYAIQNNVADFYPALVGGANATNVFCTLRSTSLMLLNKATGNVATLTAGSWRAKCYAQK